MWLYNTVSLGRKFNTSSFNLHRNCQIFMITFDFIFNTICVPYIFWKFKFLLNFNQDTPLCNTPPLDDTPLCDTPNELRYFQIFANHTCKKIAENAFKCADKTRQQKCWHSCADSTDMLLWCIQYLSEIKFIILLLLLNQNCSWSCRIGILFQWPWGVTTRGNLWWLPVLLLW